MRDALGTIVEKLMLTGMSQEEVFALLERFLRQEAFRYIEQIKEVAEEDEEVDPGELADFIKGKHRSQKVVGQLLPPEEVRYGEIYI